MFWARCLVNRTSKLSLTLCSMKMIHLCMTSWKVVKFCLKGYQVCLITDLTDIFISLQKHRRHTSTTGKPKALHRYIETYLNVSEAFNSATLLIVCMLLYCLYKVYFVQYGGNDCEQWTLLWLCYKLYEFIYKNTFSLF